jgi:hypothetical protein
MLVLSVLLAAFGLLMTSKPAIVWSVMESWKSNGATEPSDFFLWSTRFGGVMCTLAGLGGIIAVLLQPR